MFHTQTGIFHLYPHQIIYAKAEHRKVEIYLINNVEDRISIGISDCAKKLEPHGFFQIHRSYLINLNYVLYFNTHKGVVKLYNGLSLPVVKSRIAPLAEILLEK
ncbi:MAG: LytTR family transcriptional regulator DNA-binding domain-containing protein [Chitinophagales bacterium]